MAENLGEFIKDKKIPGKVRSIVEHKVMGRSLKEIAYDKLEDFNKKAADSIPSLLANPNQGFSSYDEINGAERALALESFTKVEFVNPQERIVLLKKIRQSAPLIRKLIQEDPEPKVLHTLRFLFAKPVGRNFTANQSAAEVSLIRSIHGSVVPTVVDRLVAACDTFDNLDDSQKFSVVASDSRDFFAHYLDDVTSNERIDKSLFRAVAKGLGRYVESVHNYPSDNRNEMRYRRSLETAIVYGDSTERSRYKDGLLSVLKAKDISTTSEILCDWLLDNPLKKPKEVLNFKKEVFLRYADSLGIDGRILLANWTYYDKLKRGNWLQENRGQADLYDTTDSLQVVSAENIRSILKLEAMRPGATKVLFDEFGIVFFGRYDPVMLADQYDTRNDTGGEWGVYVGAYPDHNDAHYQYTDLLNKMRLDLGGIKLRIYETGSKVDLLHKINEGRKKYGPLSFFMLTGHGQHDAIQLSYTTNQWLYKRDFERTGSKALRLAFRDDAIAILNSCDTGRWKGIGQTASGALEIKLYAPGRPTHVEKIEVDTSRKKGGPLIPEYSKKVGRKFEKGKFKF